MKQRTEKATSPLRYPGGKAALAPYLARVIITNSLKGCDYFEPFAGGAGAALGLLASGAVSSIHLNDADPHIYAFWKTALCDNQRFCEAISKIKLSIKEWHKQRDICRRPAGHSRFEVAFSTLVMNRCNRSGILLGAGPIGGLSQTGKFKLTARFYRETIVDRLQALIRYRDNIQLYNMDAERFLKTVVPKRRKQPPVFVYLDPPYYNNGKRLYLNFYSHDDHKRLASYMAKQKSLSWLMSYDDASAIRGFYQHFPQIRKRLKYSLNRHRDGRELLIFSRYLNPPPKSLAPDANR